MTKHIIKLQRSPQKQLFRKMLGSNLFLFGSDTRSFRLLIQAIYFLIIVNLEEDLKEKLKQDQPFPEWFVHIARSFPAEIFLISMYKLFHPCVNDVVYSGGPSDNRLGAFLRCFGLLTAHLDKFEDVKRSWHFHNLIENGWNSLTDDAFKEFLYRELLTILSTTAKSEYLALEQARGITANEMELQAENLMRHTTPTDSQPSECDQPRVRLIFK